MTGLQQVKKELMVYAIGHDFFGYGSQIKKRSDNRYVSIVDGERFVATGTQLAEQFDTLEQDDKENIVTSYANEVLKVGITL